MLAEYIYIYRNTSDYKAIAVSVKDLIPFKFEVQVIQSESENVGQR